MQMILLGLFAYALLMFVVGLVAVRLDDEPLWLAVPVLLFPPVSFPAVWLAGRIVR